MKKALLVGCLLLSGTGCLGESKVMRVYSGHLVEGNYIPPEAYAAYLQGVIAEAAGNLPQALAAYESAAREDDEDPEPLTRVGDIRCRIDPKKPGADEAFARALRFDPTYAPALEAKARCETARGQPAAAVATLSRVAIADRTSTSLEALFVSVAAQTSGVEARDRAVALTVASGDDPAAWDALVGWARAKSDWVLMARGLEGIAANTPLRTGEVEAGVLELVGVGETTLARRVAGALSSKEPTVARLAIDDALVRGDVALAEKRATHGHVSLGEVSARALLLEKPQMAAAIAGDVLAADPSAGCASMVAAALASRSQKASPMPTRHASDDIAPACAYVLADRVAVSAGAGIAHDWLAQVHVAIPEGDPLVQPVAVELAARGILDANALPSSLRLELAARRREAPPPIDRSADPRHRLLWHALVDPGGTEARALLGKMQRAAFGDSIVAFALAKAAIAGNSSNPETWITVRKALAAVPSDPLLLAVAVDVAKRTNADVVPARARLMAVARTPAERALATE